MKIKHLLEGSEPKLPGAPSGIKVMTPQQFVAKNEPEEDEVTEDLRKWFKEKWVRFGPDGKIRGTCARGDDSEGKPKCLPQSKAHSLGKKGRASAASRKRREDPNPERSGKAINVATKKKTNEEVMESEKRCMQCGMKNCSCPAGTCKCKPIKGWIPGKGFQKQDVTEMDNRTPQGDRREQRANSPEEKAKREKEFQNNLKKAGPELRKKLGLPEPKDQDVAEEQIDELKCWPGYTRVRGVPAGAPGSCKKKTSEDQAPMFTPESKCPFCEGPLFEESMINEKKDACYYKVKSRYKVWPSAYASGALVKCRKKGAKNWGTGGKKNESIEESDISGLMAASKLDNSYIITAKTSEGQTKRFRVRAQNKNVAIEKFKKHQSMAEILSIEQEVNETADKSVWAAQADTFPQNSTETKLRKLISRWNNVTSFQLVHIGHKGINTDASKELDSMVAHLNKPLINGKTMAELLNTSLWRNPKAIPVILNFIYKGIPYLEERIKKLAKPEGTKNILKEIEEIKQQYIEVVGLYSNPTKVKESSNQTSSVTDFPIDYLKGPTGEIGRQGVHVPQIVGILKNVLGLNVSDEMSMKDIVAVLKNNTEAQNKLRQFIRRSPVEIRAYPSDEYHLQDGHHRAFLLNLLGDKTVPAIVKEATKLPATARPFGDEELTSYLDRIRNKEKKKTDKYKYPYIHRSSVVGYYNEAGKKYNTDAIKSALTERPKALLKKNEKMKHSDGAEEQFFNIGFAALVGVAVDQETNELIIVNTCPGAGSCKVDCFAMKGGKIQFQGPWLSDGRILTFLLNDPEGFFSQLKSEITKEMMKGKKGGYKVSIRWHDAGDFFSPEYMDMAFNLAEEFPEWAVFAYGKYTFGFNYESAVSKAEELREKEKNEEAKAKIKAVPVVSFYAYTKVAGAAMAEKPKNFIINWSEGASPSQERQVKAQDPKLDVTKNSRIVPTKLFYDLLVKDEKKNLVKGPEGQWQVIPDKLPELKDRLAQEYGLSKNSILSYSEWEDKGRKNPLMKWNVIITPGEPDLTAKDPGVLSTLLLKH